MNWINKQFGLKLPTYLGNDSVTGVCVDPLYIRTGNLLISVSLMAVTPGGLSASNALKAS